jgi:hypothetical protein
VAGKTAVAVAAEVAHQPAAVVVQVAVMTKAAAAAVAA